jgi:hypothetical protein
MEKDKKNIKLIITLLAIIVVLLAFTIVSNKHDEEIIEKKAIEGLTEEEKAKKEIDEVKVLPEGERIRGYIQRYISSLENKDYVTAYDMLYSEFKARYFPTLTSFEEYAKVKYPRVITLNYQKIDRQGTYYISTIDIMDSIYEEKNFTQMFVIKEEEANKFQLSFQAE